MSPLRLKTSRRIAAVARQLTPPETHASKLKSLFPEGILSRGLYMAYITCT